MYDHISAMEPFDQFVWCVLCGRCNANIEHIVNSMIIAFSLISSINIFTMFQTD